MTVVPLRTLVDDPSALAKAGLASVRGEEVIVVIPTLNEADHIERCLDALMKGDPRLDQVRFVVADGGSQDGTQGIVERLASDRPNLELLHNPKKLQAAAVNLAARERGAGRAILVRCDAHADYPAGYVLSVADSLRKRGVASLVTAMDAAGTTCFQRANAFIVDTPFGSGGSAHRGGRQSKEVDHGHHAGFSLAAFLSIGGYDETFSHNEDAEFDRRLRGSGERIFLDADIRMTYFPRRTALGLARQYFSYGKGRARNVQKHGDMPRFRQMIPPVVFSLCLAALLLAPVFPPVLAIPAGYLTLLACVSIGAAILMKSPCGLLAGAASGIMHMSWAAGFLRQLLFGKQI